jgi:hypothetical protein
VMLEVRRDVYWDEALSSPTAGEHRVRELLAAVVQGAASLPS